MPEVTEAARARVAKLVENWDWPEPAILEDIAALGSDALPAIEEWLTPEFFENAAVEARENSLLFYFLQVLGETHNPAAIPLLIRLYSILEEDDDLFDDIPGVLRRLGPAAIEPLLSVAANEVLSWLQRASAAEVLADLAGTDPERQGKAAAGLRAILAGFLARPDSLTSDERDLISSVSYELARMADPEAQPLIYAAFDAGIFGHAPTGNYFMDIPLIDRAGIDELYEEGGRRDFPAPREFLERYREDYRQHHEEEAKKAPLRRLEALLDEEKASYPVILSPKLGRNDPCWCGSGKKYKKCHLAQDEKERVRL